MFRLAGLTFGLALGCSAIGLVPAVAGPFSHAAELRTETSVPLVDVASRRVRRNRGLAAGAIIGGALLGGAIIAGSQRRQNYYVDDGYQDRRYYRDPGYYGGPGYYRDPGYGVQSGPAGGRIIYTPDRETPYTYAPAGPGEYYPGRRNRAGQDPARGGSQR